jgi:hypothetical protein
VVAVAATTSGNDNERVLAQPLGLLEQEGDQQTLALLIDVQSLEFAWTDDPDDPWVVAATATTRQLSTPNPSVGSPVPLPRYIRVCAVQDH